MTEVCVVRDVQREDSMPERVHRVALHAHRLIRSGWCRHSLAESDFGRPAFTTSRGATRYSLVGALKVASMQLYKHEWTTVMRAVRSALEPRCGKDLSEWNASCAWKGTVLDVLEGL